MWIEGSPITDSWQDMFALVPRVYQAANGKLPDKMLLIGLGGACAPYLISQQCPDTIIDGVEIDKGLLEAAAPYFPFSHSPRLVSHVSDGRLFMRASHGQYDMVLVDAFRPPHIPFHLASLEFFAEVKQRMTRNGFLAMNIGTTGEKLVFRGIANTVAAVFPHVYYAEYFSAEGGSVFTTCLLIASDKGLKADEPEVESEILAFPDQTWNKLFQAMRNQQRSSDGSQTSFFKRIPYDSGGTVFTDDLSALEIVSEKEFMPLTLGYKSGLKKREGKL
jgi:spermidine synthase